MSTARETRRNKLSSAVAHLLTLRVRSPCGSALQGMGGCVFSPSSRLGCFAHAARPAPLPLRVTPNWGEVFRPGRAARLDALYRWH